MDKNKAIAILKRYIKFLRKKNYQIKEAYLFGSFSKGFINEDSDIDVAIILKNVENSYDELLKLMKYRRDFDIRIEPHPIAIEDFNSKNPFSNEIIKTGIKIKLN